MLVIGVLGGLLGTAPSSAHAMSSPAAWSVSAVSSPTNLARGESSGDQQLVLSVINTGGSAAEGLITVSDSLPAGVTVHGSILTGEERFSQKPLACEPATVSCSYTGKVDPGDQLRMVVSVDVSEGVANGALSTISVSGGGIGGASSSQPLSFGATPAAFGIAPSSLIASLSTLQAGAHPDLTGSFELNQSQLNAPARDLRDFGVELPHGLIFNSTVVPRCDMADVTVGACPSDTAVGVASVTVDLAGQARVFTALLYNIQPYLSEPDALAFTVAGIPIRLDVGVRTNGDYGVDASARDISELAGIAGMTLTLWGVPADYNGQSLPDGEVAPDTADNGIFTKHFGAPGGDVRLPLLTNPTVCTEAISTVLSLESWPEVVKGIKMPGATASSSATMGTPFGCQLLSFEAQEVLVPDTTQSDAVAGGSLEVQIDQNENPDELGTPSIQEAVVTAPPGVTLNSGAANGLQACTPEQIDLASKAPGHCPSASQVGTVEVQTPLLLTPLKGLVYVTAPNCDPCTEADALNGNLFKLYVEVAGSGLVIKLEGTIAANNATGQLTAIFKNLPDQPFSAVNFRFEGGPRAVFENPLACGPVTLTSDLTPWGAPVIPDATPTATFVVDWDGAGGACPNPLPFTPSFDAQSLDPSAGAFSPLTITFSRPDRQQLLSQISVTTPPGLLAMVSEVPLCGEPQAAEGTCPAQSQIGTTTTSVGTGANPLWLEGAVYLTGPYKGAPFGLSIVVPGVAGPFNLGPTTVRAAIYINPRTSQVTVISDPLPQIIDGILTHIQTVNVVVNRDKFIFNPTNCSAQSIQATIGSLEGATAAVSSPFAVGGCSNLPFHPDFVVSTQGSASRNGNGASLDTTLHLARGEANIRSVDVTLPKLLPARLATLQHACPGSVFDQNPANCSIVSLVGIARAITPVLPVPLAGPAYLVSHGNSAFPDLEVVLQGEGVTIIVGGPINVSKTGTTSTDFAAVPDAPVSSFELDVPEGPHSALVAPSGNLCGQQLVMPTTITGQNGVVVKQNTTISITGCAATKVKISRRARGAKRRTKRTLRVGRSVSPRNHRQAVRSAHVRPGAQRRAVATTAVAAPALPAVQTGSASEVTFTTALLTGTADPEGSSTSYRFELGTTTSYGTILPGQAGAMSSELPVSQALTSLAPGVTYHYRLVAKNLAGVTTGEDATFTTPAFASSIAPAPSGYPSLSGLAPTPPEAVAPEQSVPTKSAKHPKKKHGVHTKKKKQRKTTKTKKATK